MRARVIDWGERYTTYTDWFRENNCEEYLDRYKQEESLIDIVDYGSTFTSYDKEGNILDTHNLVFKVLTLGPHSRQTNHFLYLLEEPITKKVYLFNERGIEILD